MQYNSIGSVLDMLAITEMLDFCDVIEETPYFRQVVKRNLNEMKRMAALYEKRTRLAYEERFGLWLDYNMQMQQQLKTKVFVVYNCIHRFLSTRKVRDLQLTAKALTVQVLLNNAAEFHQQFFEEVGRKTRINRFAQLYSYADLSGVAKRMQPVCHALSNFSNEVVDEFGRDAAIGLAVTAINNHLDREDNLNSAAKAACEMDIETYGDALRQLEADEAARKAAESEKKAAADGVAAKMKREALATRLSERYKVTRI